MYSSARVGTDVILDEKTIEMMIPLQEGGEGQVLAQREERVEERRDALDADDLRAKREEGSAFVSAARGGKVSAPRRK